NGDGFAHSRVSAGPLGRTGARRRFRKPTLVGWQLTAVGCAAVRHRLRGRPSSVRGMTLLELLVAMSILLIAASLALITPFRAYMHARSAADAASTLAQDVALLERVAQNGGANDGATLEVLSTNPLVYECYYGRPNSIDPRSALGPLIVHRSYDDVALTG